MSTRSTLISIFRSLSTILVGPNAEIVRAHELLDQRYGAEDLSRKSPWLEVSNASAPVVRWEAWQSGHPWECVVLAVYGRGEVSELEQFAASELEHLQNELREREINSHVAHEGRYYQRCTCPGPDDSHHPHKILKIYYALRLGAESPCTMAA